MIRSVVDLPAPFGPRKPVTRPGSAVKVTSSTAVKWPYLLVTDSTGIIGSSPVVMAILPSCRAGVEVAHRVGCLVQRVGPVDARGHRAGLDEVGEPLQVAGALLGDEHGQPLVDEGGQGQRRQLPVHPSGEVAALLAADEDGGPGRGERAS